MRVRKKEQRTSIDRTSESLPCNSLSHTNTSETGETLREFNVGPFAASDIAETTQRYAGYVPSPRRK